ncbi:MAG: ABC transporter ATP-binding protein [Clostridia bacterium]|nr:ABC transporter ATP-binding protein [Clostridia bacterium]
MLRLRKYLKPYIFPIILVVMLLFCQGMSDLYLPNLMSDIVNTGIQRSGIENSAPEAVSSEGMNMILTFMKEDQRKQVEDSYILIDKNSSDYKKYKEKYSYLDDSHSIYVLKDSADTEKLDDVISRSELAVMLTAQGVMSAMNINMDADNSSLSDDVDVSKIYAFASMPNVEKISQQYIDEAAKADPMICNQIGTVMAKLFYKELGVDVAGIQNSYILHIGLLMVLVTIGGVIATILVSFIASKISAGVARTLRSDIFRKVEQFSNEEFDKFSTASLITRTTNDITQIQNIINMGLRMICYAPIMGIGGAILAASTTMSMSWIIIAAIAVLLVVMLVVFVVAMPKFKIMQKMIDRLNLVTRESLSGLLVIRAFGTERYEEERFDKANKDLTSVNLFVNRVMTFLMPVMMLIMNGVSMLVVWVGAHQIEQAEMQVGDMMAFIQYAMMIIMSFLMIAMMFIIIPRASVSAVRIADVLECDISIKDPENPVSLKEKVRGEVKFDNVSFRYKGAESDVLRNISFTAKPGETTAFIGTTGSGKTTLVNLIPRFYDVTGGKITLDGIDVRDLTQHDLREQIGLVPQKGMLFSGNIASNLRYGRNDASDDEIKKAAETAQAAEFIRSKPDQYESPIAQGGSNVSGGQKQRLAIARALVKKAPVYIFDDSFSALDFKTDAALRKALKKYTGDSAVIIVAQRISTIMYAENILVLDEGRIVGRGTHNELLKNCKAYREIAVSQNITQEV